MTPQEIEDSKTIADFIFTDSYIHEFVSVTTEKGSMLKLCEDGKWDILNPDGTPTKIRMSSKFVSKNKTILKAIN